MLVVDEEGKEIYAKNWNLTYKLKGSVARLAYFTPNWLILLATGVKIFGTGLWLKTWLFLF